MEVSWKSGSGELTITERKAMKSKKEWMPDRATPQCCRCSCNFSATRRKHHCRFGTLFDPAAAPAANIHLTRGKGRGWGGQPNYHALTACHRPPDLAPVKADHNFSTFHFIGADRALTLVPPSRPTNAHTALLPDRSVAGYIRIPRTFKRRPGHRESIFADTLLPFHLIVRPLPPPSPDHTPARGIPTI